MKLKDLQDEQIVHVLIRTNKADPTIFKEQIESTNFKFISSFDSKVTLRGIAKNIPLLASLDFVEYIEIGAGLAPDKR
jgi:hypothetical protein